MVERLGVNPEVERSPGKKDRQVTKIYLYSSQQTFYGQPAGSKIYSDAGSKIYSDAG